MKSIVSLLCLALLLSAFSAAISAQRSSNAIPRSVNMKDQVSVSDARQAKNSPARSVAAVLNVPGTYSTIQAAINAASAGDVISVAAGTYAENITINKSVTIDGAGQGVTIVVPAVSDPGIDGPPSFGNSQVMVVSANDVTVSNLTIDGDNPLLSGGTPVNGANVDARNGIIESDGPWNNTVVHHVTVKNVFLRGIYARSGGSGFNFHHNTIQNVAGGYNSIAMFNFGGTGTMSDNTVSQANDAISANHSRGTQFLNNNITNSLSGVHTDNAGDGGGSADVISNNVVTNSPAGGYGVWVFVPYIAPTVSNNTVTNVEVGLGEFGGAFSGPTATPVFSNNSVDGQNKANSLGVYLSNTTFYFGNTSINATLTGNSVINNVYGFYLETNSGNTLTMNASSNDIHGNTTGVESTFVPVSYGGTGTAGTLAGSMAGNWWGSASGPVNAVTNPGGGGNSIDNGIDYSPWWGADYRSAAHPWNWYVNGSNGSTIQEGIDASSASDVVNVTAGTYEEQIEVAKAITVLGASAVSTTIKSPVSLPKTFASPGNTNHPVVYVHDISGAAISNLTVDGAGRGNANYRFVGIGYRNAGGTVSGCTVKDVRNTPIDGTQHGVAIYALADDGNARTLNVTGNTITGFQKNGMTLAGANLTAPVSGNTVTGAGPVSFIAQNGIQLSSGANGSITGNTVSNISYVPSSVVSCGLLLFQPGSSVSTTNNIITATQVGAYYIDIGGTISGNTIGATLLNTGTATFYGIVVDPGAKPRVSPDPFDVVAGTNQPAARGVSATTSITTSVTRNVLTGDGTNGEGIEFDALGTQTLNVSATENSINGWGYGVVYYKDAGATLNASVNSNNISGNAFGAFNLTGVTMDASANWWGSASGPKVASNAGGTGDSVSSDVDYTPWLNSGTDTQVGTAGFQGDFSVLNAGAGSPQTGASGRIQEAIGLVSGSLVRLFPGTYNESPNVNKSLTLQSTGGRDATTIQLQSGPTYLGGLTIDAATVTVDGVTINGVDAVGSGLASSNIVVTSNAANVTIRNNRLKVGAIGVGSNGDDGMGILTYYSTSVTTASLSVTNNLFLPLNSEAQRAFYVNPGVNNFTFRNNSITGKFNGTAISQAMNGALDHNTVTGTGAAGSRSRSIGTWGYPDPTVWGHAVIRNNTITGTSTGVAIFSSEHVQVDSNSFSNNGVGVGIFLNTSAFDPSTITIHENTIQNSDTWGVNNTTTTVIDAQHNYWGSLHGPRDTVGTIEVPRAPHPAVSAMKNAVPANGLGDNVSEYVDYFPWNGQNSHVSGGGIWAGGYVNPVSNSIFAGLDLAALDGVDPIDTAAPPPPPTDYLYLYFLLDPGQPIENYSADVKKDEAGLATAAKHWNLKSVTDHTSSLVTIEFPIDHLAPGFKPTLYDLATGSYQNLRDNPAYAYTSPASVTPSSFLLLVGDSTKPSVTVSAPNGGEFLVVGTPTTITWSSSDGTGVLRHYVYYSLTGGAPYTLIDSTNGGVTSLAWTPSAASGGASVKVVARDSVFNEEFDISDHTFTILSSNSVSTSAIAGWNLVSPPMLQGDMSPAGVFGDDYGVTPYYTFQFSPSSGYSFATTLNMGQGYWLGSNSAKVIDAVGTPVSSASRPLAAGFNIIGNPFAQSLLKADLRFTDGFTTKNMTDAATAGWLSNVLYKYTGTGYGFEPTTLGVWQGYWIPMLSPGITIQYTPSVTVPTPKAEPVVATTGSWDVNLSAAVEIEGRKYTDEVAAFGVRPDGSDRYAPAYDAPRPPRSPAPEFIEIGFQAADKSAPSFFNGVLARDYRGASSASWKFNVTTSKEGNVTLTWDTKAISALPGDVKVELNDAVAHRVVNMKAVGVYSYEQSGTSRSFTINRNQESAKPAVPARFVLGQNYPNPFNPTTSITYGLPADADVKIVIYDALGQHVADVETGRRSAGYHDVSFDASALASGMYVYVLDAVALDGTRFHESHRMLLMK